MRILPVPEPAISWLALEGCSDNEVVMLKVKLVVVGGATESDEFQLSLPSILGRSRDVSIPLPHPLVSRQHCELFEKNGELFVRDLGSTNGTFVGSERVEEDFRVQHGSLLTIGTVTFRAQYDGEPLEMSGSSSDIVPVHQAEQSAADFDTSTITRIDTGRVDTNAPRSAARPSAHQKAK